MNLPEGDRSPDPRDLGFQVGQRFDVTREELQGEDETILPKNTPPLLRGALHMIADTPSIKGFAVVDTEEGPYLNIILESGEVKKREARITAIFFNLRMSDSTAEFTELKGRPFREVEESIRTQILEKPGEILLGVFRFRD